MDGFSGGTGTVYLSYAHVFILYIRDFFSWIPTVPSQARLSGQVMLFLPQLESHKDNFYKSKGIENIFINLPFFFGCDC